MINIQSLIGRIAKYEAKLEKIEARNKKSLEKEGVVRTKLHKYMTRLEQLKAQHTVATETLK